MATTNKAFKKNPKDPAAPKRERGQRGPGKTTIAAREAIGRFVDGNAHRLQVWLDEIANGVPRVDPATGQVIPGEFEVAPNPEKASTLFLNIIEYHVPKLSRTEFVGDSQKPIAITLTRQDADL